MNTTTPVPTRKRRSKALPVMETVICHFCGSIVPKDDSLELDGKFLCPECVERETFTCEMCRKTVCNDENAGDDETRLCHTCYTANYTRCGDCGSVIRKDMAYSTPNHPDEFYCYHCRYAPDDGTSIHNYSYKPIPVFYGNPADNRYYGIELELDDGGHDENNAYHLLRIANRTAEHIYIKHDGSLNDGFEIVTHPMTLQYHQTEMPWGKLTQKALRIGYKSHKTQTCGLHVHVNRNTFSDDYVVQEVCISRILFILERFWEEFLRFSRREKEQLEHWAHRYGFKHEPYAILDAAKSNNYNNYNRYTCVNLTNINTIEFRIFKGTLKANTIIATLQLINHICDLAVMVDTDITELNWCEFVEKIDQTRNSELIQYLKERRLYINEKITVKGDDE